MILIIGFYLLELIVLIGLILLGVFIYDKRKRANEGKEVPPGFLETKEVNIDPVTKVKSRVYYNEATGERFYKEMK
ncbi:hypothetical protein LRR81_16935 [Metabacillus sp. GX 13764]|uniref:hypothetical protein n=1 Tax=Metabacillus kandeliae TaxID=2900151 RepID=UPI001E4F3869|nr:hypothetical protein [Metabacillus kandeliae]MCD7035932.1 hypothetical protein [Metabacillus kandeliae]